MISEASLLPAEAVDAHMHIYAEGVHKGDAPFTVPRATVDDYQHVMRKLGIESVVLVQSMLYGTDNSVMLSGLRTLGNSARGIAVVNVKASEALLDDLGSQGIVGLRAFMLHGGIYEWSDLPDLGERLAARGWQMHLQLDGRELPQRMDVISRIPCKIVIDHVGKFLKPVGPDHTAFKSLMSLLATGNVWIKLSGIYETSITGAPDYEDVAVLARTVADAFPHRVIWASNWPHPNLQPAPDDGLLIELSRSIVPDPYRQKLLFSANAQALFGFGAEGNP
ncbi:amidohydrolase family protein [Brucella pseudogrignonensis]|uniref:Amidohydrolase family protein n=1 Tax=Brucella pseudogrignonensis TaxID=419475 RepID=A0A256GUR0_9HYPH|nr:amidohydrolase family protein [Brucella pseudogrignonensis]OYR30935.1 amidohydrolase family protein [Brucella pseudogrignonensis]